MNKFAKYERNKNIKVFIVYMNNLALNITIYSIKKDQIFCLFIEKLIIIAKNSDFTNIF